MMTIKNLLLPLSLLAVGTVITPLLTACSDATKESESKAVQQTAPASSNSDTAVEQDLKVSLFFLNYSLDPKDYFNGWILMRVGAGETLLRLNDQGQVQPWLARDFKVLTPTSYQLTLQDGLKFSDGSTVTATDVQQNLERVMALNPRTKQYFSLDHIEVVSPVQLVIHTKDPVPELFANLCEPLFSIVKLPAEALPPAQGAQGAQEAQGAQDTWPNFTLEQPITTGPYRVSAFVPNERIEVVPNPYYRAAKEPDQRYSKISYFYMPDAQSRVMALQAGEVDLIPTVDYANLSLFADPKQYQVLSRISSRTNVVYLNHSNQLLANKPVRQAMSLAINREQIVSLIGGQKAGSLIAPDFVGGQSFTLDYDLAKAQSLLDQAGIIDSNGNGTRDLDGRELSFKYYIKADHGSADSSLIAQSLQQDLKQLQIELQLIPSENLAAVVSAGDFDLYSANDSTVPTGDPFYFLATRFGTAGDANYGHYSNPQIDALLKDMQQSFEQKERLALTGKILGELNDDTAALFINHIDINEVARADVHNLHLYSFDYYFIDDQVSAHAAPEATDSASAASAVAADTAPAPANSAPREE